MEKKLIEQEIFSKHYDGMHSNVFVKDLPIDLKPDDIINIHRVEARNNSYDEHTILEIIRMREETDEELKEQLKSRRYENYLKLKKEFENE